MAGLAVALGWWQWGGPGAVMGITVVVFWLLLQFSRALRVMKNAAAAPKGRVASAVMLHSRLNPGMTLLQILPMTGSLGERVDVGPDETAGEAAAGAAAQAPAKAAVLEHFRWADDSGAAVRVCLACGKLRDWVLERPAEVEEAAGP